MIASSEDTVCPYCGKQLVYRKEIRDHLTLRLCQQPLSPHHLPVDESESREVPDDSRTDSPDGSR